MGMLYAAYFDASGKQDGFAVLTVAGAVSPVKKWIRFEKQWKSVLNAEGVSEFHATDFASSGGEYKDWKGDTTRRSNFLKKLITIIKENTNKLFTVSVELDAWKEVDCEYCLTEALHSPYALAGFAVIEQAIEWAERKQAITEFIFEEGDEGWDGLLKLCAKIPLEPVRLPKAKAIPCQVGDLLAWKSRIAATNSLSQLKKMDQSQDIEDAKAILREIASLNRLQVRPIKWGVFSPDALRDTCRNSGIPKRSKLVISAGQESLRG